MRLCIATLSLFGVFCLATVAQAAITATCSFVDNPAPGLERYDCNISTTNPAVDPISTISFANLAVSNAHHIWGFNGSGFDPTPLISDLSGLAWDSAWDKYDTHLTQNLSDSDVIGVVGSAITETNDGSDPAGLALVGPFGFDPSEGLGGWGSSTVSWAFDGAVSAVTDTRPLAQIVLLAGTQNSLGVRVDSSGQEPLYFDIPLSQF